MTKFPFCNVLALASRLRETRRLARLRHALARLPDPPRRVYELHCVDLVPLAHVARQLGLSEREVEAHLASALTELARAL